MLIRPTCSAIACMRTIRNLRRTHAEILGIQRYFLSTKTGPEVKKTASERLNLKSLDTRLSDDQIDELIDGLQKDFDKGLKEKKKREQQLDDYKMVAFMLVVSTAIAVVSFG